MRIALLLACLISAASASSVDEDVDAAIAAEMVNPAIIPGLPPATPPSPADAERLAYRIASELRCPVCQGLSVADSTTPTAVNIHRRVRELVDAGYAEIEIKDYFVSKFGEWILLNPNSRGLNRLVWIGPLLAAGLGLGAALTFLREEDTEEDIQTPSVTADDPYAAALLKEVDDD
jgi:cytochrome c-type biogenesis protein CcmH